MGVPLCGAPLSKPSCTRSLGRKPQSLLCASRSADCKREPRSRVPELRSWAAWEAGNLSPCGKCNLVSSPEVRWSARQGDLQQAAAGADPGCTAQ